MTAISVTRSNLWDVTSRTIVYAAIGAALYGVLSLFQFLLPGTGNVYVRPAFSLVAFFGYSFGPLVGLFVGFVGNAIGDQLNNFGFLTYWNWSLANGLAGFIAGLAPLYLAGLVNGPISRRAIGGAIAGIVGTAIGFLFAFSGMFIAGDSFETVLTRDYIPVLIADVLTCAILVPILVYAWEPIKEQLGR